MDLTLLEPTAPYEDVAAALLRSETGISEICFTHLKTSRGITYADLYGMGIGRRALALSAGYRSMVEQRNSICALPMVRMQLDTALRLYAGFFVEDPMQFCKAVFNGKQIKQVNSDDGNQMHDRYLLERVSSRNPWMKDVYKLTSGYIHFSDRHIKEVFRDSDQENVVDLVIGPNDHGREEKHFHEPSRCMHHLHLIIQVALQDWFARMCGPVSTDPATPEAPTTD
ncbi:hypothetical protein [Methylobacterium brachiatum]|uniref:hypothetical protein n=1 Tax=Methylobacterium brachiatum TaxID=269660 RepID=UPI0008E2745C|nr:hypothetical protein [Methylobacterium brachiatum]SFI85107.1 hypothetical protein SAMN02799642_02908 [Methylobacterium brachiatum]